MRPRRWVEVTVRVAPADVEAVADVLGALAPGGVAIEPAIRVSDAADFAYELLDAPGAVRACFPAPLAPRRRRALRRRLAALPLAEPLRRMRFAAVEEREWAEEWKRHFGVMRVGRRLVVRPSWERYEPRDDDLVIELDPGDAFGTGQHASTRLCLRALEHCVRAGHDVIDVGTGSGILAVAAALLGARSVRALDTDAAALRVAHANVALNGAGAVVRLAEGSLGQRWPWPAPASVSADVVVANISSTALVELMPAVAAALRPGGVFAGGGFIAEHAPEVEAAAAAAGLRSLRLDAEEEWRCLVAERATG